jgi:polar amino acid transport system substrate-binding protein
MKFGFLIEPPFNYRLGDRTVTGCDVELAKSVLTDIGEGFEPIETSFAELLPGVASGRWRMTTGLFATEERRKIAAFSRPIWALSDGLLVSSGNPKGLTGYRSIADDRNVRLAVIRDQVQHRSAIQFGVPAARIQIFETYGEAAEATTRGAADAYASVARAHFGFMKQRPNSGLDVVSVPPSEKEPAFGCFAFAKDDTPFRQSVDDALSRYLGSAEHRAMMALFGFSSGEIDLVASWRG